jgi:oligosaccharide repeat unit polymerase
MTTPQSSARATAIFLAVAGVAVVIPVLVAAWSFELTLFVAGYWLIGVLFFVAFIRLVNLDLLAPAIAWPVILFLYMLSPSLNALTPGMLPLDFEVPHQVMHTFYFCGVVGLIGFASGTLAAIRKHQWSMRPLPDRVPTLAKTAAIVAIVILPFALRTDIFTIQSYAERAMDLRLERMASNASGVYEALVAAIATLFLGTATWFLFRARSYGIRFAAALVLGWYVTANTLAGWRGVVVSALCIPLSFYHYRVRRIGPLAAACIAIFLYFFMAAMSVVRTTSDPMMMIRNLGDSVLDYGMSFARLDSVTELQVGGNLMRLITGVVENETEFTLGRSVLTEMAVYVPRALYPGRPLSMSEIYMEVFYPGARQQGEGRGLFILAEGYWAFGVLGVFLFMFVFGWSLQAIYEKTIHTSRNDFGALLYGVVFYTLVVEAVRSGVLLSYKVALIRIIPFIVVLAIAHMTPHVVTRVRSASGDEPLLLQRQRQFTSR